MHNKRFLVSAAIFGATGVALGAFGAHGLQRITSDEKILHGFQTAVNYQLIHALALLATGILAEKIINKWISLSGNFFITGVVLFSGSLYLITFFQLQKSNFVKIAGPITPLGGLLLIAGWLALLHAIMNKK